MIIKMMLDELVMQLKEVSQFENIEIIKVVDSKCMSRYYKCSESANNHVLEKLNKLPAWNKNIFNVIREKKSDFNEKSSYEISGDIQMVTSYTVPILFNKEVVFLINMISFKNINFIENIKEEISEIISSFEDVFCLNEMIKLDMIRDRV